MIKIVTDSTALISDEQAQQYDITVVPLNVIIGDHIYKDGVTIDGYKLNEYINNNPDKDFPTTSQPAVGDFIQAYDQLGQDGSQIISLNMTGSLSGTAQTALQAARISKADVTVINSETIDQGLGHEVIMAAKWAQSGKYTRDQLVDKIHALMAKQDLYVQVSTLQNLVRGGRISKVSGMVSKLFDLHVVMQLKDEELKAVVKGRGRKTLKKWTTKHVQALKDQGHDLSFVGISYTGSDDYANFVRDTVKAAFPDVETNILHTGSVVTIHAGNDACGIIFFEK